MSASSSLTASDDLGALLKTLKNWDGGETGAGDEPLAWGASAGTAGGGGWGEADMPSRREEEEREGRGGWV